MNELNLVYTVDDSFLHQASVSLSSIIFNNSERFINVYVATDRNSKTNNFIKFKKFHENEFVRIIYIDAKKYDYIFDKYDLDKWGSNSYYVYWRLVVFDILKCDFAFYLDADIICRNKITYPELGDKTVGCVIDSVHPSYQKNIGLSKEDILFNTGTMFVNVEKWKDNKCTERCLELLTKKNRFLMADQDIFSIALSEFVCVLDCKYNYFSGFDYYGIENYFEINSLKNKKFYKEEEVRLSKEDILFYHCLDGVYGRPWEKGNRHPLKIEYEFYSRFAMDGLVEKNKKKNLLFKIEEKMEILPPFIYNKLHNFALFCYFKIKTIKECDNL